jgi:hypothetical protein
MMEKWKIGKLENWKTLLYKCIRSSLPLLPAYSLQPTAYSLKPKAYSLQPIAFLLILLKILFEFYQAETSETTQIMINTIGCRVFCHGRSILEIIKQILSEVHLGIPELLDTLALIHNMGSN